MANNNAYPNQQPPLGGGLGGVMQMTDGAKDPTQKAPVSPLMSTPMGQIAAAALAQSIASNMGATGWGGGSNNQEPMPTNNALGLDAEGLNKKIDDLF